MIRDADNVAEMVPTLFDTGQESLQSIASDEQLRSSDPETGKNVLVTICSLGCMGRSSAS